MGIAISTANTVLKPDHAVILRVYTPFSSLLLKEHTYSVQTLIQVNDDIPDSKITIRMARLTRLRQLLAADDLFT